MIQKVSFVLYSLLSESLQVTNTSNGISPLCVALNPIFNLFSSPGLRFILLKPLVSTSLEKFIVISLAVTFPSFLTVKSILCHRSCLKEVSDRLTLISGFAFVSSLFVSSSASFDFLIAAK